MALSYTTPKRHRQIVEVEFELDGDTFRARKPKDSVLLYLTAAASDNASDADKMYAVMQFINGCLTPAAQQRIQSRLRDYDDDLELDDLVELMEDLAAEWKAAEENDPTPPRRVRAPGAGKVITPDGRPADVIAAAPNRAAKRAAAKPVKKAAPAKKTVTGRALPR